jgi:hypothetical protein
MWKFYVGVVGVIILLLTFAVWMESLQTSTSPGVETVSHNTAQLHPGQQLVVHNTGKHSDYWTVKYNHDGTVSADCGFFCKSQKKSLCGSDCKIELDPGMWSNSFKVTENSDGSINIRWPNGYFKN